MALPCTAPLYQRNFKMTFEDVERLCGIEGTQISTEISCEESSAICAASHKSAESQEELEQAYFDCASELIQNNKLQAGLTLLHSLIWRSDSSKVKAMAQETYSECFKEIYPTPMMFLEILFGDKVLLSEQLGCDPTPMFFDIDYSFNHLLGDSLETDLTLTPSDLK